jgi:hypothetical protein
MDYSSSVHDPENPAGASPWGSSPVPSPQHNRTTFGSSGGDIPPSPSPYRDSHPVSNGGFTSEGPGGFNRPGSSDLVPPRDDNRDIPRSDANDSMQAQPGQQFGGPLQQQQQQHQYQQSQGSQQNQTQDPNQPERAPNSRRATGPQYKLQAKITGLERTGRKDPILRFDVYVRFTRLRIYGNVLTFGDQFTIV